MKTGLSNDEMAQIRAALEAVPAVEKAVLFGSRAMGLARSNSDVDILLYGDALQTRDVLRVAGLLDATTLPYQFDLIRHDANNAALLKHVRKYGKVIFQRQKMASPSKPIWRGLGMTSSTLADACVIVMGQSPAGGMCNSISVGLPLLNGPTEYGAHHPTPVQFTTDARKRAKLGDVLFCVRGSTTGRMNWADREYAIGRGIAAIRHKSHRELQPLVRAVIEYGLSNLLIQTTGSTFPNVSSDLLFNLPWPDLEEFEQRAIAHILGTLDDKIELNRRMNETLEAMARALFKAWFIDFEPVRAKLEGRWRRGQSLPGLPAHLYDLFPDRLVDSELGEIPAGWECVPASQLIDFNPNEPLRKGIEAPYIEMASLPTTGCWPEPFVLRPFGSGMRFRNGDTLLARITPCLENGKTAFIQCLPENSIGWGSTEYIVMRTKAPIPSEFGYLLARNDSFREQAIRSMTGTSGRQRVQADSVAAFKLIAPPNSDVWDAFSRIVTLQFKNIKANVETIENISQLRDTLLPKLISGELRIGIAEAMIEQGV